MRLLKKILGLSAANLVSQVISAMGILVTARVYAADIFGKYYVELSIATVTSVATTGLIYNGIAAARRRTEALRLYTECSTMLLLITAVLYTTGAALDAIFAADAAKAILRVVLLSFAVSAPLIQQTYMHRIDGQKYIALSLLIRSIALLVFQWSFGVFVASNVNSLVLAILTTEVIVFVAMLILCAPISKNCINLSFSCGFKEMKKNLAFAKYYAPSQIFSVSVNLVPALLMEFLGKLMLLGSYSMAMRLIGVPAFAVASATKSIYWRQLQRSGEKPSAHSLYILVVTLLVPPIVAGLTCLVTPEIIDRLLGTGWSAVVAFLPLVALWLVSSGFTQIFVEVVKNSGLQRIVFVVELIGGVSKLLAIGICLVFNYYDLILEIFCLVAYCYNLFASLYYRSVVNKIN